MSNSTFATAADAIDYSDDDNEESSQSEDVSDVSVAASSDDSDDDFDNDDDDNNDDGDMEEAVFLRNAWDIQNWMSRCVGTAAMEDRRFRSLFGARIEIVLKV